MTKSKAPLPLPARWGAKKPATDDWDKTPAKKKTLAPSDSEDLAEKKKLGRPAKLDDPQSRNKLVELIGKGVPISHACAGVGISVPTFCTYREKHEWFRDELATAIGNGVEKRLKKIEAAADAGDWRAAAWLLEHCQPEHFAKNRIEITGADGGPLTAGIGIYLPKKDGKGHQPVIEVAPANQIENASD